MSTVSNPCYSYNILQTSRKTSSESTRYIASNFSKNLSNFRGFLPEVTAKVLGAKTVATERSYRYCNTYPKFLQRISLLHTTSYNGSNWLALEMRTRPLRMRRITWLVSRGSKTITYLESPTPTTFIGLRRRLRVVYTRASAMLKPLTA